MSLNQTYTYKVVLLGDTAVGKSSISSRFVRKQFFEFQEPTIGAAFLAKKLEFESYTVKFEIWDTAGQERYNALAPMYYRGAKAALVVYDVSIPETFNRAKTWINELQTNVNNIFIILVGNKCDLKNVVNQEDLDEYVQDNNIIHFLCSAKEDINITNIFNTIAKELPKEDNNTNNINLLSSLKEDNKNNGMCC
jgi:small GTP-binding protein